MIIVIVGDSTDIVLYQKSPCHDRSLILMVIKPYRAAVQGIAVESSYTWVLVG